MTDSINFILLGDQCAGKSTLLKEWLSPGRPGEVDKTIAIDLATSVVKYKQKLFGIRFYDTAGQDFYDRLLVRYVFDADCCVVVFDVTDINSWKKVEFWFKTIFETNGAMCSVVLIGNKIDLESSRIVSKKTVRTFIRTSQLKNVIYSECSAKTKENVLDTYHLLINFAKTPHREVFTTHDLKQPSKCIIF